MPLELLTGAMIGLLAGLTATGGGVFLSPVVILLGWVSPRQAAGLASPFILVNSIAGLAGAACLTPQSVMPQFPAYAAITVAGTVIGATLGIRYLRATWCQIVLGIALSLSGIRLVAS